MFSEPWTPSASSQPIRKASTLQSFNAHAPVTFSGASSGDRFKTVPPPQAPNPSAYIMTIDPRLMPLGGASQAVVANHTLQDREPSIVHDRPGSSQEHAYPSNQSPSYPGVYPVRPLLDSQDQVLSTLSRYPISSPDFSWSEQHRAKRVRLGPHIGSRPTLPPVFARPELPESVTGITPQYDQASPNSFVLTPFSGNSIPNTPGTPGSSVGSEEVSARTASRINDVGTRQSTDLRRLSVSSLLSGPPGGYGSQRPALVRSLPFIRIDEEGSKVYGYDYGHPDLDVARNNDSIAVVPQSPVTVRGEMTPSASSPFTAGSEAPSPAPSKGAAFQRGGYYAEPVAIGIPKEFEPLPSDLTDNPMNLLYFHHFLNHTARVLTPHDCPDNPLKTILPKSLSYPCSSMKILLTGL